MRGSLRRVPKAFAWGGRRGLLRARLTSLGCGKKDALGVLLQRNWGFRRLPCSS
jgi:hypothetical protein